MVTILPQFDPGGDFGKALGSGIGEATNQYADRHLLRGGVNQIKKQMETKREAGEQINPLDVTLSMISNLGNLPGGLNALSELAPAIHKEILRSNLMQSGKPGGKPGGKPNTMPSDSVIEDEEIVTEGRSPNELSSSERWEAEHQKQIKNTGDVSLAAEITNSILGAETAEDNRRNTRQQASANFLDAKIGENFPAGISAPFKNELSKKFFDRTKFTDNNKAWKELMPKFRNAQTAEESLKNATGSNRPLLFNGDLPDRMKNAQVALKDISDIDPEYAMGMAMNTLDYGPAEAAKIVRPGGRRFDQFVGNIQEAPKEMNYSTGTGLDLKSYEKDRDKYESKTQKNLDKFFKDGWDTEKDSLLALRADLYDKGFTEKKFLQSVDKAFPGKNQDKRLSEFNQNEYTKLSEPIIPGLQEIFSLILSGRFSDAAGAAFGKKVRGKR